MTLTDKLTYGARWGAVSRTNRYGIWAGDRHDERDSRANSWTPAGRAYLRRLRGRRRQLTTRI